ncbi:MAG: hypothetical protein ACXW5H_30950 [Thermoanaerobaculia bacterium]
MSSIMATEPRVSPIKAVQSQITESQFHYIADAAMNAAATVDGSVTQKWTKFDATLVQGCMAFGDNISKRFVLVAYPELVGHDKWNFEGPGLRLDFFETGPDGCRYVAVVY